MRRLSKLLLGTLGVAALAGTALAADRVHVLNVALPDGSVRQIRYTGDVAPRVVLVPVARTVPVLPAGFGDDSPFAMLDRMSAMMDAQADAMMHQAALLSRVVPAGPATLDRAALAELPKGATSYSFTSYSSSNGGCSQSVQMTSFGTGQAPKVVRQSSGDCSSVTTRTPTPTVQSAKPAPSPIIPARYVPDATKAKPAPVI